jgi:hypothetical protein
MKNQIRELKQRIFGLDLILEQEQIANKKKILLVSDRIFNKNIPTGKFSLEEVLESLSKQEKDIKNAFLIERKDQIDLEKIAKSKIQVNTDLDNEKVPKVLLYEISENIYCVYRREKDDKDETMKYIEIKEDEKDKFVYNFIPTDIIVRKVPEHVLGVGILGRAYVHLKYIEILDTLIGNDYVEVLTHEILHIQLPHYSETKIRLTTRNYVSNARYN